MKINGFSHVNLRTARLAEMVDWYGDILDMHPGDRPDFKFGGAWLYATGLPFIHLVEVPRSPSGDDPKLEHFAFDATGMTDFLGKLTQRGIAHSIDPVPGFPIVQVNLRDPDGNHIHIDFDRAEATEAGLI